MAKIANTFVTTDAVGNREELSDVVDRVQKDRTPLYSMISKGSAKSVHPEWERDEVRAPAENAHPEGDTYAFDAISPAERMGNYTQIFHDTFIMSRTQNSVDNAGRAEQFAKKKLDSGIAIRRDVELAILKNTASVGGEDRRLGGLPTWLETNTSRGATTGANGGFNSTTGLTEAATAGDQRAFTKALLDDVMAEAWTNGAEVNTVMVSPYNKRVFTTFQSADNVPQFSYDVPTRGGSTIVSNATMYNGDFGTVTVVPNYMMALDPDEDTDNETAGNVFLLDRSKLSFLWLDRIQEDRDAAKTRTSDARQHVLVGEGTLKVANERGLGVIADTFGLSATT